MLISIAENKIENTKGYHKYQYGEIVVYYSGIIFVSGKKMGAESLNYIVRKYKSGAIPFRKIFGSYAIIIIDGEVKTIFSDNSNMHGILISEQYIGSNLSEIGAWMKGKLDDKLVCEYLVFYRPVLSASLIKGVRKLESNRYIVLSGGGIEQKNKNIGAITGPSSISDPKKFFKDMVYAMEDAKVIIALTGGYDSRLVASAYNYDSHADCFISGDNPNGEDIKCSRKAAKMGKIHWKQIVPPQPKMSGDELIRSLYRKGAYKVQMNTSGYRIHFFMRQLKGAYDILLTGDAGDMHKDFWDIRKIPFYPRGFRADMRKFVRKYFISLGNRKYLGDILKDIFPDLERETYESFELMKKETVMKSCLCAGWKDWIPMGLRYTEETAPLQYSPLQEFELVKYSYGITPKGKRMNMFHRRLISFYNQPMAKAKTIYRTNCSDGLFDICTDVFRLIGFYTELILKYMARKIFHTDTRANEYVNLMDLSSMIRESETASRSVLWAKEKGYLEQKYTASSLPEDILSKIIYMYLLEEDINLRTDN